MHVSSHFKATPSVGSLPSVFASLSTACWFQHLSPELLLFAVESEHPSAGVGCPSAGVGYPSAGVGYSSPEVGHFSAPAFPCSPNGYRRWESHSACSPVNTEIEACKFSTLHSGWYEHQKDKVSLWVLQSWMSPTHVLEVAVEDVQSLYPSPWVPWPCPPSPHPPSQAGCHMVPQSELSLPPTVAVPPQQRVVGLEHFVDTGVPAAQVGAVPPVVHGVAGCSHFDAPPQNDRWSSLGCLHVGRCWEGGRLGTPGEKGDVTMYSNNDH